jgi:hypothetical protein
MMTIYIDNETKLRVNIYAPYKGFSRLDTPEIRQRAGVVEAEEPTLPADFNYDDYTVQEIDPTPYVIFTKKSDEQIAAIRWEKLKQLRDQKIINGGAKVGDKWYHSDTHSKVQQLSLLLAGENLPAGIQWKTMDGTFVEMTPTLAQQLYQAQMAQEQAIFNTAELKRLDDSPVDQGWPEVFE